MTTSSPIPDSPFESTLGTKPVGIVWIHPEAAYAYLAAGDMEPADAAEALRNLAAELLSGDDDVQQPPAETTTSDFAAVLTRIHEAALTSPAALGETADYQRGWDEAMAAVAAIAGTYEPTFVYRADNGHTGPLDIDASGIAHMHRMGFQVERRVAAPWELVPKGSRD